MKSLFSVLLLFKQIGRKQAEQVLNDSVFVIVKMFWLNCVFYFAVILFH